MLHAVREPDRLRRPTRASRWAAVLALILASCGGGGGGAVDVGGPGHLPGAHTRPDLVFLFVSGHTGTGDGAHPSYLDELGGAGPYLLTQLASGPLAGKNVVPLYYRDGEGDGEDGSPGLLGLIADLEYIGSAWPGVRVCALAHSHGAPRLVHAIASVPNARVHHLVLLDGNSYLPTSGHDDAGLDVFEWRRTVAAPGRPQCATSTSCRQKGTRPTRTTTTAWIGATSFPGTCCIAARFG